MGRFSYIPLENEPSIFTHVVNRVNRDWVFFVKRLAAGIQAKDGLNSLQSYKEFFSSNVTGFNMDGTPRKLSNAQRPEDEAMLINNLALVAGACKTMSIIKQELAKGVTEDGFETPQSILTADGLISMRWVLHVAREDGMSPEEAYVFAQTLIRK